MPPLIRWQWLWQSRWRVLTFGLMAVAAGGLLLTCSVLVTRPWLNRRFYVLAGLGIFLIVWGGIHVLNGLLAPDGAFGHHHDEPLAPPRRKWRRTTAARPTKPQDDPIPLADDPPK